MGGLHGEVSHICVLVACCHRPTDNWRCEIKDDQRRQPLEQPGLAYMSTRYHVRKPYGDFHTVMTLGTIH